MSVATAAMSFIVIHRILKNTTKKKQRPRWWIKYLYKNGLHYGNRLLQDMMFECIEDTVKNFTRMSLADFQYLAELIKPMVEKSDTFMREAITVEERLAITLRFLATGDSYTSLQYLFRVSKQSISSIVPEVAIIKSIQDYIKVPSSEEEWLAVANEFEQKWNFPHAIGGVDGKHVMLQAPWNSGTEYYNYKNFFSIVLFALVDANYNFMYVDIGCQGRISDGGVFKNTSLYRKLENRTLNIPTPSPLQVPYLTEVPYMLLGDKAFALSEYLIKPFEGNPERGSMERIFNYRLSRSRRVVENAFGILSVVFRVLRKPILLQPEKASKIVLTTIYLHNLLRNRTNSCETYSPPGTFDSEKDGQTIPGRWRNDQSMSSLLPIRNVPRRSANQLKNIRLHLEAHFASNGAIPWQNNY